MQESTSPPERRSFLVLTTAMVVSLAVSLVVAAGIVLTPARAASRSMIGGPFALQDGDGRTISDETLRGRPFLVYFGYTHCPDVCPTELARIADVLTKMGDIAIPALFITVDPDRDTPKVMQDYAGSFGPSIIGLSGSTEAIAAVERAYRVFAQKGPLQSDGSYSMDHSAIVYLMDKNGAFVKTLDLGGPPEETAKELQDYL